MRNPQLKFKKKLNNQDVNLQIKVRKEINNRQVQFIFRILKHLKMNWEKHLVIKKYLWAIRPNSPNNIRCFNHLGIIREHIGSKSGVITLNNQLLWTTLWWIKPCQAIRCLAIWCRAMRCQAIWCQEIWAILVRLRKFLKI